MSIIELNIMLAVHSGDTLISVWVNPFLLYVLQISNDGFIYSNSKTMILYDGACQTCEPQESGLCTLKVCISLLSMFIMKIHTFSGRKKIQKNQQNIPCFVSNRDFPCTEIINTEREAGMRQFWIKRNQTKSTSYNYQINPNMLSVV